MDATTTERPKLDLSSYSPVITADEFMALARIGRTKWYSMKRNGAFRALESPVPNRYSREKVLAWLEGR